MRVLRAEYRGEVRYGVIDDPALTVGSHTATTSSLSPLTTGSVTLLTGDPFREALGSGGSVADMVARLRGADAVSLDSLRLLAPVEPSKVVGTGLNYTDHAAELKLADPVEPVIFIKPSTTVVGPGDPIVLPRLSERVDHEAELAIVIGARCKDAGPVEAAAAILGYTCANDVTARDLQFSDGQWSRAKSFDTFCPLGPWIVTGADVGSLAIEMLVNGEVRQSSSTANMHFRPAYIVGYVSQVMTLLPGDVIVTGTPPGVSALHAGDTAVVRIESIGELSNPVVSAARA